MTIRLSGLFTGIAFKRLRATEVDPETSHGHEFQGVQAFKDILGASRRELAATFLFLCDDSDAVAQQGKLTWYDAREGQTHRSAEYRLYYSSDVGLVQGLAQPGDLVVVAVRHNGEACVIITRSGSSWEHQVRWLFALPSDQTDVFQREDERTIDHRDLDLASRMVLDSLGIDAPISTPGVDPARVLAKFPAGFPSTREMSEFARGLAQHIDARADPDLAVIRWIETEVEAFSILEQRDWRDVVSKGESVSSLDSFLAVSKSFINRRKSRAGSAFENQLEEVFRVNGIRYSRGQVTENKKKPDFLFPSVEDYRDPEFPIARLTVLGAKISCKDRWRQVVTEATRVPTKHLATLEPAISSAQTDEMRASSVRLVVPASVKPSYSIEQQQWLLTVKDFIGHLRERQSGLTRM